MSDINEQPINIELFNTIIKANLSLQSELREANGTINQLKDKI